MTIIITVVVITSVVIGVLVSSPALFLPFGQSLQSNKTARKSAALWFAALAFLIGLLFCSGNSYLGATVGFVGGRYSLTRQGHIWDHGRIIGEAYDKDLWQELEKNKSAIINEFWLRETVPPPWQQACFTRSATVCNLADLLDPLSKARPKGSWLIIIKSGMVGILAGLVSGLCIWFIDISQRLLCKLGFLRTNRPFLEQFSLDDMMKLGAVPPERRRKCLNCEAVISQGASKCPWCGMSLSDIKDIEEEGQ